MSHHLFRLGTQTCGERTGWIEPSKRGAAEAQRLAEWLNVGSGAVRCGGAERVAMAERVTNRRMTMVIIDTEEVDPIVIINYPNHQSAWHGRWMAAQLVIGDGARRTNRITCCQVVNLASNTDCSPVTVKQDTTYYRIRNQLVSSDAVLSPGLD